MAEYIDRETLISALESEFEDNENCRLFVSEIPTADVVEVVRCKDCVFCKYNEDADVYKCDRRGYFTEYVNPDEDYCSKGERRSDNV